MQVTVQIIPKSAELRAAFHDAHRAAMMEAGTADPVAPAVLDGLRERLRAMDPTATVTFPNPHERDNPLIVVRHGE